MRLKATTAASFLLLAFSTSALAESGPQSAPSTQPARAHVGGWESFGGGLSKGRALPLKKVLKHPARHSGKTLIVKAPVQDVCVKKGCWMMLDGDGTLVRVRFKDYGFFVPMDIHGATAKVEGVFSETEISVEMAKHYLEDAGKHAEAAALTEPQKGYTMMATAVLIKR